MTENPTGTPGFAVSEREVMGPARSPSNLGARLPKQQGMEPRSMPQPKKVRPSLTEPSLADVVGGLVLLAIAALLVGVAVVAAAGL
jgi:hypothetical protein